MIPPDGGVGVALSGGKDSLSLLYMLRRISGRGFRQFPLHAFHVSGEFSCGAGVTTSYLKEVCDSLDVPLPFLNQIERLRSWNVTAVPENGDPFYLMLQKKRG